MEKRQERKQKQKITTKGWKGTEEEGRDREESRGKMDMNSIIMDRSNGCINDIKKDSSTEKEK